MMNTKKSEQQTLEAVNPFELYHPEWEVSRQSVQVDSLVVRHDNNMPPSQIDFCPISHHLLLFQLSHGTHQVNRIGKQEYIGSFSVGELFLHPANYSGFYSWETTDEAISFIIKPDFLSRIAEQSECLNPDKIELRPILCDRDPHIEYIARSFLKEMETEGLGGRLYSEALATQLAIDLLRHYCPYEIKLKQYRSGLSARKLQAAIDYIQANLEATVKLDDLAQVTKTSSYHFSRLFKQSTGMAPYQYVIKQRVELGKQLLKQEDLPISEISLMCGFSSQSSFTTAFRKSIGVTPKTYRRQL